MQIVAYLYIVYRENNDAKIREFVYCLPYYLDNYNNKNLIRTRAVEKNRGT